MLIPGQIGIFLHVDYLVRLVQGVLVGYFILRLTINYRIVGLCVGIAFVIFRWDLKRVFKFDCGQKHISILQFTYTTVLQRTVYILMLNSATRCIKLDNLVLCNII